VEERKRRDKETIQSCRQKLEELAKQNERLQKQVNKKSYLLFYLYSMLRFSYPEVLKSF